MRTAAYYRSKATDFRRMAADADDATREALLRLAVEFEAEADRRDPPAGRPRLVPE